MELTWSVFVPAMGEERERQRGVQRAYRVIVKLLSTPARCAAKSAVVRLTCRAQSVHRARFRPLTRRVKPGSGCGPLRQSANRFLVLVQVGLLRFGIQ